MKKIYLIIIALVMMVSAKAQWVNDPAENTFLASCQPGAAEILISPKPYNDGFYIQWLYGADNGWSPWIQSIDKDGVPQWNLDGIHITTPNLATWSPGYALAALNDGIVSMFRTADAHHWVVKINEDGTFPWGEHGIMLFDGQGGGRSELLSTYYYDHDAGLWALGTDMDNSFLQYINADGTLRPTITISDPAKKCTNGVLIPAENGVFVVYSKHTLQGYTSYNKEIYVAGYNKNGEQTVPETLLFGLQTVGASYIHYAIPDYHGGAYVYQYHNGIGGVYNTYVTHFDATGTPTITNPNGVAVHTPDYSNYYTNACATVDLNTNDIIVAYHQKDAETQSQHRIYVNRITETGEVLLGDGMLVADYTGQSYSVIGVDANDYTGGFVVIYGTGQNAIEAAGYGIDNDPEWNTTMSSTAYNKTISENTSGFREGQDIIAWINSQDGGLYGQNIGWDGTLGEVTPPSPPPVPCCYAPDLFDGSCVFNEENESYGAMLTWEAPAYSVSHYNLYRQLLDNGPIDVIEVDADITSYYDEPAPGTYKYQLTAVYPEMESEFANTVNGDDNLIIEIPDYESVSEPDYEVIVNIIAIYSINGQYVNAKDIQDLPQGIYIIKGLTASGKSAVRKIVR